MYEIFEKILMIRGISPAEVSKATGIAESTLSNWKKRKNMISGDNAIKIAEFLGISIDYLMTGKDAEKESVNGGKYYFNDETAEIAQAMYENTELRVLFDAARDAEPEDLNALYDMLLALKRKENRND